MSNEIGDRGPGRWTIVTYNPLRAIGPIRGFLTVAKDFHQVYVFVDKPDGRKERRTIFNCSSLNVAYALNENFFKEKYPLPEDPDNPLSQSGSSPIEPSDREEPQTQ
jgi:hypothetical protein